MSPTGLIYHNDYLLHNAGAWHPERPERLLAIIDHLTKINMFEKLQIITPAPADLHWIENVHTTEYINYVKQACSKGIPRLDMDTGICLDSYNIALLAAGGGLAAADAVLNEKIRNAFCAVRPPGHHAETDRAKGFCLFNNIAILTRYLQKKYLLKKILIIDWDVHHGNGTQNSFYDDPTVFYFSVHQSPHYQGSGLIHETGVGKGENYTMNVPLASGFGDTDYINIFQNKLLPAAQKFQPDFVLISAGFDAHQDDPLAGMFLTKTGFENLTEIAADIADEFCQGRIISLLEGGYNLDKLAESVAAHINVLLKRGGNEKVF